MCKKLTHSKPVAARGHMNGRGPLAGMADGKLA